MSTESKYYRYNPEKRNVFVEIHRGRRDYAAEVIGGVTETIASYCASIVEVFLRKRFGERYITLRQSIIIFLVINFIFPWIDDFFRLRIGDDGQFFLTLFSLVYLGFAIYHRREITRYGSAYDFKRFSLSDGESADFWYKRVIGKRIFGIEITIYTVQVVLEPAIPVLIGIILLITDYTMLVGILLIFCGLAYHMRNFSQAQHGRNWVLDNIDKQISNQMTYDVFIGKKPKKETKGVYFPVDLPKDEETLKSLYDIADDAYQGLGVFWANDELDDDKAKGTGSSSGGKDSLSKGAGARGGFAENGDEVGNGLNEDSREGGGISGG